MSEIEIDPFFSNLVGLHDPSRCEGRGCVVHHPSDHHMVDWPKVLRGRTPFDIKPVHTERICEHGVGHPDPDDVAYFRESGNAYGISVHGCDGCCTPPELGSG